MINFSNNTLHVVEGQDDIEMANASTCTASAEAADNDGVVKSVYSKFQEDLLGVQMGYYPEVQRSGTAADEVMAVPLATPSAQSCPSPLSAEAGLFRSRSELSSEALRTAKVDRYFSEDRSQFYYKGEPYLVLSGENSATIKFEATRIVSIGGGGLDSRREITVLNTHPLQSPRLERAYQDFVATYLPSLADSMSALEIMDKVSSYIKRVVFPWGRSLHEEAFFSTWIREHYHYEHFVYDERVIQDPRLIQYVTPVIPIDDFIEKGWGVCRHQALVACYFISRLKKERADLIPIEGKVFHVRSQTRPSSSHVWCWYRQPDGTIYHCDPMYKLAFRIHRLENLPQECSLYHGAIQRELARFSQVSPE